MGATESGNGREVACSFATLATQARLKMPALPRRKLLNGGGAGSLADWIEDIHVDVGGEDRG